jgi:serine/threonine-protein kinase
MDRERVADLFEHAVGMPVPARAAWLDHACAGDLALRAELERLLRADANASAFMEQPPDLIREAAAAAADAASGARRFGVWRVLRPLGVGGMGEVWLAERSDGEFEQRAAIKQLAYPTPGLMQRFLQERQILARLEHPSIARLIDGGVDASGAPYLAMEYVDGVPITDYAREHTLDLHARLNLFLRVCEAVQYAHQNLIVHRDLKPSNIFVTAEGAPKLLDFGIAKVLATTDGVAATQTMARLLTPDYAAPEQFHGGAITTATDVYALGVVLYELLAGMRPRRHAASAASFAEALTEPPPPSAAIDRTTGGASARRRALRGDLDRIVLKALAPEPARRYPSAEALAADVKRYLGGRPITARGDSPWYRLRKFTRRNRYPLAATVVAFAMCLAAALVSLHQARIAREQAQHAREQTQRAEAVRRLLVGVFEQADPTLNQGKPFTAQQLLQMGERRLAEDPDINPAVHADLTGLIGKLYWNISENARGEALLTSAAATSTDARVPNDVKARNLLALAAMETDKRMLDEALEHATRALELAISVGTDGVEQVSAARRAIGNVLIRKGDSPRAETMLREALASDLATFGERHASVADGWQLLGTALDELGRYDESGNAFRRAIAIWPTVRGERSTEVAGSYNDLGLMLLHKGDPNGAEAALRKALELCMSLYGPDSDNTRATRSNLLRTVEQQGRFEEALSARLEILEDAKRKVGETRPEVLAFAHNFISGDYRELGRFAESEASLRDALAIWAKVQGSNDENDSATPLTNLGIVLRLQGRYAESEKVLTQALAIQRKHSPKTSQWLNLTRAEYGTTLRLQHRHAEALRELRGASADIARTSEVGNPWLAQLDAQLSEAELDAGHVDDAAATATAALQESRKSLPPRNYRLGPVLFALARAQLAQDRAAEAEPLLREALEVRGPPRAADDPRVLEVEVALANALTRLGKADEARTIQQRIEPMLKASASPYAVDLRTRLASH